MWLPWWCCTFHKKLSHMLAANMVQCCKFSVCITRISYVLYCTGFRRTNFQLPQTITGTSVPLELVWTSLHTALTIMLELELF
jgi:hypothetical protein